MSIPKKILIITPVYNDWESFQKLVEALDLTGGASGLTFQVLAVDDGSPEPVDPGQWACRSYEHIAGIEVLHLARNLGHQKAIAIGLAYAHRHLRPDGPVIVMDCDGEDRPQDIPALYLAHQRSGAREVVFASRAERSEGLVFRVFYQVYRLLFLALTGHSISMGNFCLIPPALLGRIVHLAEIWNHFAAGVLHAKIPHRREPIRRGTRYAGRSRMNFTAFVLHGLSAISVYLEVVTVRLVLAASGLIGLVGLGFLLMLYYRYFTPLAIPGWATTLAVGLAVIGFQAVLFITLLSFFILNYRSHRLFIPVKDYQDYFSNSERIL